ncbi:MAG: Rrf2 family transcriptional regulator [Atopobiaceae bacterium]|jgi:Rrf2 family protein|nr:Rrf2 family transcriptional regulator [Atopobiaceae bacterium]
MTRESVTRGSVTMDISRKTDYALRMMAALVRHPDGVLSVRTAADDNDVPYSFARSIQHDLVRAGLIESLRGSRGGMRIAIDPDETTLLQVVEAIQGPVGVSSCDTAGTNGGPCPRMEQCRFNPIWKGACALLVDYLGSVTLEQVVSGSKAPVVAPLYCREDSFADVAAEAAADLACDVVVAG